MWSPTALLSAGWILSLKVRAKSDDKEIIGKIKSVPDCPETCLNRTIQADAFENESIECSTHLDYPCVCDFFLADSKGGLGDHHVGVATYVLQICIKEKCEAEEQENDGKAFAELAEVWDPICEEELGEGTHLFAADVVSMTQTIKETVVVTPGGAGTETGVAATVAADGGHDGFSRESTVGIVVGALLGFAALLVGGWFVIQKRKKNRAVEGSMVPGAGVSKPQLMAPLGEDAKMSPVVGEQVQVQYGGYQAVGPSNQPVACELAGQEPPRHRLS
ncbi:hypothetical protein MKZ38_005711 [Zalerion maritima]|uniref:Extracellular membrane protein CFEM domain-containing protein n=1 Tax=Zalerion maritima TaxID=339359 RepID=A0AAD5RJU8_9PEZI|nr:hypothetical protein MKZ38_005711 [Zalerion maritima]